MPESVTDRPTSAHEKLYLMTKAPRYFYDAEAVRLPHKPASVKRYEAPFTGRRVPDQQPDTGLNGEYSAAGANLRNVWSIATHSFSAAHFATFPPALVEPCIKAGTSERGACASCGAPWRRVVATPKPPREQATGKTKDHPRLKLKTGQVLQNWRDEHPPETTGWEPTCGCGAETRPCVVLDCFGGAGTVGLVADRLQRDAVLIEISPEYAEMARARIQADATLLAQVEVVA